MTSSHLVRIARPARAPPSTPLSEEPPGEGSQRSDVPGPAEHRPNVGGSQRAIRVTAVYLVVLAALFVGFVLYDRNAPGGTASPAANGLWLFTVIFGVFALFGAVFTLHPAPRAIDVAPDRVTVVGRWGRRRVLPSLDSLSTRVVRRYPAGWLAGTPVEQVELWGRGIPLRTYLVEADLFRGASPSGQKF